MATVTEFIQWAATGKAVAEAIISIKAAWTKVRAGSAAAEAAARDAELTAHYEIAIRELGAILYESRISIERVKLMATTQNLDRVSLVPFDFDVSDALFADFCRTAPTPQLLAELQSVRASLKQVDFYLRMSARTNATTDTNALNAAGFVAIDLARMAYGNRLVERFNSLHRFANALGAALSYGTWIENGGGILPSALE
ncbi:MAG: hypothetical protein ACHREM_13230 [Polyangiales bacterium]